MDTEEDHEADPVSLSVMLLFVGAPLQTLGRSCKYSFSLHIFLVVQVFIEEDDCDILADLDDDAEAPDDDDDGDDDEQDDSPAGADGGDDGEASDGPEVVDTAWQRLLGHKEPVRWDLHTWHLRRRRMDYS